MMRIIKTNNLDSTKLFKDIFTIYQNLDKS